jgi:hypothetical protein
MNAPRIVTVSNIEIGKRKRLASQACGRSLSARMVKENRRGLRRDGLGIFKDQLRWYCSSITTQQKRWHEPDDHSQPSR